MAKPRKSSSSSAAGSPTPAPVKDKAGKFRELATKRVNRTVHAIKLIANLSNCSSYEYTDEQVARLMTALTEAVDYVGNSFSKNVAKAKDLVRF